jgi:hypothetical protein
MFSEVKKAAESLKAGDDYRGEENSRPDRACLTPEQMPEPTDFQKGTYNKASDFILALLRNPDDEQAIVELHALNGGIIAENIKENRPKKDGLIQYQQHITHCRILTQYIRKETKEASSAA